MLLASREILAKAGKPYVPLRTLKRPPELTVRETLEPASVIAPLVQSRVPLMTTESDDETLFDRTRSALTVSDAPESICKEPTLFLVPDSTG